jgi:hypothetical protein
VAVVIVTGRLVRVDLPAGGTERQPVSLLHLLGYGLWLPCFVHGVAGRTHSEVTKLLSGVKALSNLLILTRAQSSPLLNRAL